MVNAPRKTWQRGALPVFCSLLRKPALNCVALPAPARILLGFQHRRNYDIERRFSGFILVVSRKPTRYLSQNPTWSNIALLFFTRSSNNELQLVLYSTPPSNEKLLAAAICHMLAFILSFCWTWQLPGFGIVAASALAENISHERVMTTLMPALLFTNPSHKVISGPKRSKPLSFFGSFSGFSTSAIFLRSLGWELWFSMFRFIGSIKEVCKVDKISPFWKPLGSWRFPTV